VHSNSNNEIRGWTGGKQSRGLVMGLRGILPTRRKPNSKLAREIQNNIWLVHFQAIPNEVDQLAPNKNRSTVCWTYVKRISKRATYFKKHY
jgi:hypothetical protein